MPLSRARSLTHTHTHTHSLTHSTHSTHLLTHTPLCSPLAFPLPRACRGVCAVLAECGGSHCVCEGHTTQGTCPNPSHFLLLSVVWARLPAIHAVFLPLSNNVSVCVCLSVCVQMYAKRMADVSKKMTSLKQCLAGRHLQQAEFEWLRYVVYCLQVRRFR